MPEAAPKIQWHRRLADKLATALAVTCVLLVMLPLAEYKQRINSDSDDDRRHPVEDIGRESHDFAELSPRILGEVNS